LEGALFSARDQRLVTLPCSAALAAFDAIPALVWTDLPDQCWTDHLTLSRMAKRTTKKLRLCGNKPPLAPLIRHVRFSTGTGPRGAIA
jgi:hypothetical protein